MKEKDELKNELIKTIASLSLKEGEVKEVMKAYEFARTRHSGQRRIGGEDYIYHLVRVALAVAKHAAANNISSAKIVIILALLHDVVEDTEAVLAEVIQLFGEGVGEIVNALSHEDEEKADEVYLQRVASGGKLAILVKRFDKLDNIRSLCQAPTEFRNGKIAENREALPIWRRIDPESAVFIEQALKEVQDERHHPSAS